MIHAIRVKNTFLRLVPYLISIVAGGIIYILAIEIIRDENLSGLFMNIAAGLLSIPIIFISYELINDLCSKDIKDSIMEHLVFDVNYSIIDILKTIHSMLNIETPLDEENLDDLLSKSKKFIKNNLSTRKDDMAALSDAKDKLYKLIHNNTNLGVLSNEQIKTIMNIIRNITVIYKETENKNLRDKDTIEQCSEELLHSLSRWIELGEEDAIINHHSFRLI